MNRTRSLAIVLLLTLAPAAAHGATTIECNQPTAELNTLLVCDRNDGDTCRMRDDFIAVEGCELDFKSRKVVFDRTFDVGRMALRAIAGAIEVSGSLRAAPGDTQSGGVIDLKATAADLVVRSTGKIDVSGDSAGFVRLTAVVGSVDLQVNATIRADGKSAVIPNTAFGGTIAVLAGTSIVQNASLSATGGVAAQGGSVQMTAGRDVLSQREIDASGGAIDGGAIEMRAGDDVRIDRALNVSGSSGGCGGDIGARAGADEIGGVKVGGALTVSGALTSNGSGTGSGEDAFGCDGGEITLAATGPVSATGSIKANGGSPDGEGGVLVVESGDPFEDRLTALDGDLTLSGDVELLGGSDGDGGELEAIGGRDLFLTGTATKQQGGSSGGVLSARAGRDVHLQRTVNTNATATGGNGGLVELTAGLSAVGTLTITSSMNASARSGGRGAEFTLAGCHVNFDAGVTIDATTAGTVGGGVIDLAARRSLAAGANAKFLATPNGRNSLTRPASLVPMLAGATFDPPREDFITSTSNLFPLCPECGDGAVNGGEVCDNAPSADGACCNETCSALLCATPTPTATPTRTPTATVTLPPTVTPSPTVTALFTGVTPTSTPTPTADPTSTRTPTSTPTPPVPTPTATAPLDVSPKLVLACERALGKAASKLALAELGTYETCAIEAFRCIQSHADASDREQCLAGAERRCAKAADRLLKARRGFGSAFSSACGADRLPFEILRASSRLGFEKLEPTCMEEIGLTLNSAGAIVACVQLAATCRVERAIETSVPRAPDLLDLFPDVALSRACSSPPSGDDATLAGTGVTRALKRCQRDLAVAGRQVLRRTLTVARGCADTLIGCRLLNGDVAACEKVADRCAMKLAALEDPDRGVAARVRLKARRACRDLQPTDILGAAGIRFERAIGRCTELGVPTVTGVDDVAACITRAYRCAATAVIRHGLPFLDDELAQYGLDLGDPFCDALLINETPDD